MRLLLILLVVLFGFWLWRSNREARAALKPQKPTSAQPPLDMVGCTLCSVHVAAVDAVQGRKGPYCCVEHRQRAEP
jgi:uncharacterized protein